MKLIIEDDEGRRSVVPIELGEATVGRDEENTIRLNERNVSRRHARLIRENGTIYAEDLDSYNGVFINGDRVKHRQDIHEGDILRVGDFQLELRGEGMSRRTEETTQRAGPPEGAEVTKPNFRLDDGPEIVDPSEPEQRHEPTAIIRVDQMQERAERRDSQTIAGARARLLCVSTQFAGREFEIARDEAVIGRTEDNDIAIDHRSVSRHHAKIIASGDSYRIIDMKSANGTLVNGEEYAQIALKAGDLIELGHVKLRFVPPGEHYAYQPDELAAISKSGGHGRPSAPVENLEPVSEYVPPREVTNPGFGANVARVRPEGGSSSNTLLYAGLGVVVLLLAAVLAVLLLRGGEESVPVVGGNVDPSAESRPGAGGSVAALVARMTDAVLERDWDAATQAADTILALEPGQPEATKVKARIKMEREAALAFETAIELQSEDDWAGALAQLESIPAESALSGQASKLADNARGKVEVGDLITQASAAIEERRYDDAEALAERLAERDPEASASLVEQIGEQRRATAKGGKPSPIRRVTPTKTSPKPNPKTAKRKNGDEDAEEPDEPAPAAKKKDYNREAIALIKAKKYQEALEPLQACVRENASNCKCYRTLGIAHAKLMNNEKATRAYKTYIELCPDQPDVPKVKEMLGIQ